MSNIVSITIALNIIVPLIGNTDIVNRIAISVAIAL